MFNLEVDADHCYRVGEQGILVHNASEPKPTGRSAAISSKINKVFEENNCCVSQVQTRFLAEAWREIKFDNEDMGVVYVLRDRDSGEIMKVGKTTSKYITWESRWRKYVSSEMRCNRKIAIDAWAFPFSEKPPAGTTNCVPTIETIEIAVRSALCPNKTTCLWDASYGRLQLGYRRPGVPGELPDDPKDGYWDNCVWVQGPNPNPPPPGERRPDKEDLLKLLRDNNWNQSAVAKLINPPVHRAQVGRWITFYQIEIPAGQQPSE